MLFLLCYLACALIYLLLAGIIILQAKRTTASWLFCAASLATAAWAIVNLPALQASPSSLVIFDLVKTAAWCVVVVHLFNLAVANRRQMRLFVSAGVVLLAVATGLMVVGQASDGPVTFLTGTIQLRLLLAVSQIVLLENLYRQTASEQRWHVGLTCVALGSLAVYDLVLIGDAVLARRVPFGLVEARAVVTMLVAPLLAVSAARNRNWGMTLHASRTVVFHTATLMASGIFLISLAAVAELLKHERWAEGSNWAELVEVALIFSGVLSIAVLLVSASARNRIARLVSEHFFTFRYDYRREWLRCLATLSEDDGADPGGLPRRAIRAIATIVDSPAGLLLTGEPGQPGQSGLSWAGSWNLPAIGPLPPGHPLLEALADGRCLALSGAISAAPPLQGLRLWLAVPLMTRGGGLAGCVLLAPPRAAFRLDEEVFSLLGVLAREVSTYLAEQRAARMLVETRDLRVYAERFTFVAHDIKNVAGQLRLLSSNAERHIADPAFQRDMLATIDSSVRKIGLLIRRLETTGAEPAPSVQTAPLLLPRIEAALASHRQGRLQPLPPNTAEWQVGMAAADLDAVLTHLLDNAASAAGSEGDIRLTVAKQQSRIVVDITDDGPGMTPEFIRDELFRPFITTRDGGSGIGAYQARELLRRWGGDLLVLSRPGKGTTMRLLMPHLQPGQPAEREAVFPA